jgi:hypothetical protein
MEQNLFRMLCLLASFLCLFVIIPSNFFQNIPFIVNLLVALFGIATFLLYRRSIAGHHHLIIMFILLVLLLDATWFLNGGTFGSVPYYFFCAFMYPLIFFRGKTRLSFLVAVVTNGVLLIALENRFPHLVTLFRTPQDRMADLVTGLVTSALSSILMIWTVMKSYDRERERLLEVNRSLEKSLAEISTLEGLLPICAGCKKIRDDEGKWTQIEEYISANSDVSFSHGMCPECVKEHYPEYLEILSKE